MRRTPSSRLPLVLLGLVALGVGPADAAEPDPESIPSPGTVVPAFALYPYDESVVSKQSSEERNWVELDQYCGVRGGEGTVGVLLAFLGSETGAADLAQAAGWHRKWSKAGLRIIAVSEEPNPADFANTVTRSAYKFPVLDDRHQIVATRYGLTGAPFTFLLDPECRVIGMNNRSISQDAARLEGALGQLVQEARAAKK